VGEIGLDYFIETLDRERQQALFDAQLQLAADFDLPALIHVRRSHAAVIATLKRFASNARDHPRLRRQPEEAREYIKLGSNWVWAAPRPGRRRCACIGSWPSCRWNHGAGNRLTGHGPAMYPGQRNSPAHLPAICAALAGIMASAPSDWRRSARPMPVSCSTGNQSA
jgi:TatD DNase family protein